MNQQHRVEEMTAGQRAYEEDMRRKPNYWHGEPRKAWHQLTDECQESWEQNPTPRTYDSTGKRL